MWNGHLAVVGTAGGNSNRPGAGPSNRPGSGDDGYEHYDEPRLRGAQRALAAQDALATLGGNVARQLAAAAAARQLTLS
jgi:hypothetical protein